MDALKPGQWIRNDYRGSDIGFVPKKFKALLENHDGEDILILLRNGRYIDANESWFDFLTNESLKDDILRYKYCPKDLHHVEVENYHRQSIVSRPKEFAKVKNFGLF